MKRKATFLACLALTATLHAVTLKVTVPAGTPSCFVAGDFNGWDAGGAIRMESCGTNMFTIDLPDVSTAAMEKGYKYLSGPDWKYVEKGASGEEISNRTTVTSADVVASWASVYYFNPNIKTATLNVDGYERKVEILLPEGYATSSESYPVVYYVGVQQRYNNAGSDTDRGDDFFGTASWNAATTLPALEAYAGSPCIIVATYSFVAENIPYSTPEFMGSGTADSYINSFMNTVMPYINNTYRTLTSPANTVIMGADLGGMLSMYAALTRPDTFGRCLAMSPLLWINHSEMSALAATADGTARILVTYGSNEPAVIKSNLVEGEGISTCEIAGGYHDDDSWGQALPRFYGYLAGGDTPPAAAAVVAARAPRRAPDIATTDYHFYSAIDTQDLLLDNTSSFTYHASFHKGSSTVSAKVLMRDIPVSVKTKFYWNLKRNNETDYMLAAHKDVGFSSKKSSVSWLRVVILSDETVENVAASSTGFTLQNAAGKTSMTPTTGHKVKATAAFENSDKSFTIHYGSVNSNSDMGAITPSYSVSSSCTQATIEYDFETNAVDITETAWGDVIDNVKIAIFQGLPAVAIEGEESNIAIVLDETLPFEATLRASSNYGTAVDVPLTATAVNSWHGTVTNLKQGIYTLTLDLKQGNAEKKGAAQVCLRVVEKPANNTPYSLTHDPYEGIDWATTGRYKANFHTHTSQSFDTQFRTDEVVDRYHNAGYKILALTDHDANPYPWDHFDLYNPEAQARNAEALGMLAIPGVELSKDNRNTWNEATGGEFNHHNDFFTGRKGMEFASLQESYAYTAALGGMQIINHPGQYWNLNTDYTPGEKNSPRWHADNFLRYPSLVGLEVYNQGNRRPNDRILWDQILSITMPERPVWGYSCDDTHTAEQYFRNYDWMLMPELSVDALKQTMLDGTFYFSYEYTGSGRALAPAINAIAVDHDRNTITIDTDAPEVKWICGTDRNGAASTRKSTVVGHGKTFDFTGYRGNYVRALLVNDKGETCTQPFAFSEKANVGIDAVEAAPEASVVIYPSPAIDNVSIATTLAIDHVDIHTLNGALAMRCTPRGTDNAINVSSLRPGLYIVTIHAPGKQLHAKLIKQ